MRALGPFDLITISIMNDAVRVDSISRWTAHVLDLAALRRMSNARRRTSPTLIFFFRAAAFGNPRYRAQFPRRDTTGRFAART
jgi:hypothetical protein